MPLNDETDYSDEDTFKILVATDIHLGYNEKHPERGDDSFISFEEILKIGAKEEVDFILLGGDLFHDSKPSPYCIQKCSELIKKYCFGDKPVALEFLSDQSYHFQHLRNPIVNYEDPNINVAIPIFSIHGNHDDPTGIKAISAIDLLSTNGLVNYFGRWTDYKNVEVIPILLQKGSSRLALYGLSHIQDQRLARLFRDKKVSMVKPDDDWFNILVLHQNRANRGANNFIPSSCIPEYMDLAIWGHEHDCHIVPQKQTNSVYISQPGSSVATSLSEGESLPKHVGLLFVKNKEFQLLPVPLLTVRPFIFKTIELEEPKVLKSNDIHDLPKHSMELVIKEIDKIIESVAEDRRSKKQKEIKPLIRIVVKYHDEEQQFNAIRLSQNFIDRVANSEDIILQKPIIKKGRECGRNRYLDYDDADLSTLDSEVDRTAHVKELVDREFLSNKNKDQMKILSIKGMGEAVSRFIENDDADAIADLIDFQIKETTKKLIEMEVNEEDIDQAIESLYKKRQDAAGEREIAEIVQMFDASTRTHKKVSTDIEMNDDDDDDNTNMKDASINQGKGRGSKGGKGSRGPRTAQGSTRSYKKANMEIDDDDDDDDNPYKLEAEAIFAPAKGRGSRGGKGSRGPRAAQGSRGKK